jgi:hypothetical protein
VQDARGLHLQPIATDGLASAIISLLPPGARGTEKSVTVPLEQLLSSTGVDFLQRRGPGDADGRASSDNDRKTLARLHAQLRLRGGQIGANARNRMGGRSRSPVLSWFDTETGRYFTQATRGHDAGTGSPSRPQTRPPCGAASARCPPAPRTRAPASDKSGVR